MIEFMHTVFMKTLMKDYEIQSNQINNRFHQNQDTDCN